jgi:hypothetical protein
MTAPINPVPLGNTAQYMYPETLAAYQDFLSIPKVLQGLDTTMIYLAPNGDVTHLAGPNAGQEGVYLYKVLQGEQQLPFEQVVTESAFQWGATIQRTNYTKRLINFRVMIVGDSQYTYQLCDNRWWDGQDETQDGWLGVYTRFGGWRWIPVRPYQTVSTAQNDDPVMYGNNAAIWDITWISQRPWYSKETLYDTWSAAGTTQNQYGYYTGTVVVANQGDMPTYVQYLVNGSGLCTVQDNNSNNMVALPEILDIDGPCLVDTDPMERTLTAASDAFDDEYYQYLQSAGVLNFFLTGVNSTAEPWWMRGYTRFVYNVPPLTTMQYNVWHNNPNATVTVMVTQRYKRSR